MPTIKITIRIDDEIIEKAKKIQVEEKRGSLSSVLKALIAEAIEKRENK